MKTNNDSVKSFYEDILAMPMLCQSCGMCEAVCPVEAIQIKKNAFGQYIPYFNETKCINCRKCIRSCISKDAYYTEKSVIGPYREIYIAHSNSLEENKNGSSGGVVSALLKYGQKKEWFEEVLTVSHMESPVYASPIYTKDIDAQSGSKYVSTPLCTIYEDKKETAYTALPCEAKAIRRQNKEAFIFGLFCSKLSLEDLVYYVIKQNKMDKHTISDVTYRKGDWPGNFSVHFEDTDQFIKEKLNRSAFNAAYNSYNFSSSGCLLCNDYFAEAADLSFGDPWGRKQYVEGYNGETVVIVRSEKGKQLIQAAILDGVITASKLDLETVIKGHIKEIYNKKTAIIQRLDYIQKKTEHLNNFDKNTTIPAKSFKILNRYALHNNWQRRGSVQKYKKVFNIPIKWMAFVRFGHAFLLSKRLKQSHNLREYLEIAKKEKIGS